MCFRHPRTVLRPALVIVLAAALTSWTATAPAVTRSAPSADATAVIAEPIPILAPPRPALPAGSFRRYEGPLGELETRLFDDAVDGKWDGFSLVEAALIAGGVDNAGRLGEATARFDRLAAMALGSVEQRVPAETAARELFDFMHREILVGGYELECTDLAATLEHGKFNCVSSTVLFNCLAARLGIEAVGVELPGHAMSRLRLDGKNFDVETTCPAWFSLQHDPQRRAALIAKTIGVDLQAAGAQSGREVSAVELVAMIYYNRGVDLLTAQRFAEAAAANAKALRLDPSSETARGNLLATLNNWAITVGSGKQYERAIDLLRQGMNLDPGYETFAANYVHLYYQWSEMLCTQNEYRQALTVLGEADPVMLGSERLAQLRQRVYRRWARQMIQEGKSDQALQLLQTADAQPRPVPGTAAPLLAPLSGQQDALSGSDRVLERGVNRQPQSRLLQGP